MKTVTVGNLTIPLDNIEYLYEGDGTAYGKPYLILKSGRRINMGWGEAETVKEAMRENT